MSYRVAGALLAALLILSSGPARADAEGALHAAGISLLPGAPAGLAAQLAEALAELPAGLAPAPGGPMELAFHAVPRPFGMGDGSDAAPEWTDGRARFHLYALAPSLERRATYRLERLTAAEHERLWRKRALIHALLQRWDDARGFSARRSWRRLDGWLSPLDRPLAFTERPTVTYHWAFSRLRGRDSASLDLVTFAEEALAPVERVREDALPVDDTVRCQEPSKSRVLAGILRELPGAGGADPLPRGRCPALEAWLAPERLSHLEVLFAAASSRHPESVFGHLLLRPIRTQGALVEPVGLQVAVQLAALTSPVEETIDYLYDGSTGGYSTVISLVAMIEVLKQNVELEQRTLRRFRLNLPPAQTLRVMERIWEQERRGYTPYLFLTDNCARALIFLLSGALEEEQEIPIPGTFWVMPAAALDSIAALSVEAPGAGSTPLLTYVPEDFASSGEVAERALGRREALVEELSTLWSSEGAAELRELGAATVARDPVARAATYRGLAAALAGLSARSSAPRARAALAEWLACTVLLERHEADLAEARRVILESRVILLAPGDGIPTAAALLVERQRAFEREDLRARTLVLAARQAAIEEAIARAPRRPYTEAEGATVTSIRATMAAFDALTDAQAALMLGALADAPLAASAQLERERRISELTEQDRRWMQDSGYGRFGLGAGVAYEASGLAPMLALRTAVLEEQLGDPRLRGLYPGAGLALVQSELRLQPRAGWPRILGADATMFGLRTLGRPLPHQREGLLDELGWGLQAGADHRASRDLPYRGLLHGQLLAILDDGQGHERFTVLGAGLQGQFRWSGADALVAAGPRLELLHRTPLPGPAANALHAALRWSPAWALPTDELAPGHELRAELGLELLLGGLLVGPRAWAEWEDGGPAARERFEANAGLFAELP